MGQLSKDIMKKANILPRLQLGKKTDKGVVGTGKHHVKLIEEKLINGKTHQGKVIPKVRFIFEEGGEQKRYEAPLNNEEGSEPHYFVQSMTDVKEGDELILEMVKIGPKNVIKIQKIGDTHEIETTDDEVDEEMQDVQIGK